MSVKLYLLIDTWCFTPLMDGGILWQIGGRPQQCHTGPRQMWPSPSPLPLGLVAWEAYSDWVIHPLPAAGLLLYSPCICTDFSCIWVHIFLWMPPCYNIGIDHPVFDRIELTLYHKWIQQLLYSWYMQNAVVPLFPVLCTSSNTSPKY